MSKQVRNHIIGAILIFIFGGIINVTLLCTGCLDKPFFLSKTFYIAYCYSGIAWAAYWKGSEFLVSYLDRRIAWIEAPVKRFIVSLILIAVYVFIVVWALDIFFDTVFFNKSLSEALADSNSGYLTSFLITLTLNIFMHGRGFLLSWRQASIDMEKLKTEQIASQFNSLKNQVNPHFLFNSLNALSSLVYDNQDKAVEFIRKLSQVYRYVLDSMDDEVVPLEQEMGFVKNFIFLQKIRFGDNLKVNISEVESDFYVPPLAIQILVENAIKHNVISEKDPLTIDLEIKGEVCTVRNNLKEKKVKDSTGIGLSNIKSRYQYLSNAEVTINKTEESFEVHIPLLNIKK